MRTKHTGTITALLLTALLFWMMPGLVKSALPKDTNRMDERLRPSRLRMLTVWLLPGEMQDAKLIRQLCTQFEKERDGVRIFLRTASSEELYAPDAVLPDVLLFETGSLAAPEGVLLPLARENHASGMFGGVSYALPLWLDENVLCFPAEWTRGEARQADSLLGAEPAQPDAPLTAEKLPWGRLLEPGTIRIPMGTSLQQMMLLCPMEWRGRLSTARGDGEALVQGASVPVKEGMAAFPIMPSVSDHVRYAALCRDGGDAAAFVQFLASADDAVPYQPIGDTVVPNAFAHTREALQSLCLNAFEQGLDPVETLLKLR